MIVCRNVVAYNNRTSMGIGSSISILVCVSPSLLYRRMSDSDPESNSNTFVFNESLTISNKELEVKTTISASFIQRVGGTLFTNLDFYRSPAIATLLGSRMSHRGRQRSGHHEMRRFCKALRQWRDRTFRNHVISKCDTKGVKWHNSNALKPKNRRLQAIAMQVDHVDVNAPSYPDVTGPCAIRVLASECRSNRHSPLWVQLTAKTCDYITKVIASYQRASDADEAPSEDDSDAEEADAVQDQPVQDELLAAAPLDSIVVNEEEIVAPHVDASSASTGVPEPPRASSSRPATSAGNTLHAFFNKVR